MRRWLVGIVMLLGALSARAQYNIDRLITSGEIALHYEDYVLSIQYFNQVLALKPYLYRPWHLRATAKYYLEDYVGAENDASEAIKLNPYVDMIFDLRAIARIRQERYDDAINDYTAAIKLNPMQQNYWFNRAICEMNIGHYDEAIAQTDTITRRWSQFASAYSLMGEIYLHKQDTVAAMQWFDKSLQIDPYDGNTWMSKASVNLSRQQWFEADTCLGKALHLKPKLVNGYISRALARLNTNNLRGAMDDYDTALDLDPNNFLAHYNRGLLRMQLGDDNRAIEDFDYVVQMEPGNMMAVFNRAMLLDQTGDYRAAIREYSRVIDLFPNFWTGLSYRAQCYRKMGQIANAEKDEFRILKAQMDKHLGIQPRWTEQEVKEMRKRGEVDLDKYASIVVDDDNHEQDYQSEYRGRVQNRSVALEYRPLFALSFFSYSNGVKSYQAYDRSVELFNQQQSPRYRLFVASGQGQQPTDVLKTFFASVDSLTSDLSNVRPDRYSTVLLQRAVAYAQLQNYPEAIDDLSQIIASDSTAMLAFWQRSICQSMMIHYSRSQGIDDRIRVASALYDIDQALNLVPDNSYLYYNKAYIYIINKEYARAIENLSKAIHLDNKLAEAYFNRGIVYAETGDREAAVRDLSMAGELGLYDAYSVIKRISKTK